MDIIEHINSERRRLKNMSLQAKQERKDTMANVSKEELLHIAKLADLNINDNEIDKYLANLQDILNFANTINSADTEGLKETIGENDKYNVFRKDEVQVFEDNALLLQNAKEQERNMFKIPKVIQ